MKNEKKLRRARKLSAPERLESRLALAVADLQIIDNGSSGPYSAGYWQSPARGAWVVRQHEGFFEDAAVSMKGTGLDVARWSFGVEPGEYRVAATWAAAADRATNAPYTIWDGDTKLNTLRRNQQLVPTDETDPAGFKWAVLGTVVVKSKTLAVTLSDLANGAVCADAVRIQRVSAPLTFAVEPLEAGAVVYEPVAPPRAGAKAGGMLSLRLTLDNLGTKATTVEKVVVGFPFSTLAARVYSGSRWREPNSDIAPYVLPKNASGYPWWFRHDEDPSGEVVDDRIWFEGPAPQWIRVEVHAAGYPRPVWKVLPVKPHVSPVAGGSYLFPARAADMRPVEYWWGATEHHATGKHASQIFGYDFHVVGHDAAGGGYSELLPGTSGRANVDFRIFGKPLYAMAAGKVVKFIADVPSNPAPLEWSDAADRDMKMLRQREAYWGSKAADPAARAADNVFRGSGNCLYIQHGSEVVLYAHLDTGSIPKSLQAVGAAVTAGQFIGRVGNTGNSTAPHLHIHAIRGTQAESGPLRPFLFRNIQVLAAASSTPGSPVGPWSKVDGRSLPKEWSLVWPAATKPTWYPPGQVSIVKQHIPEADFQTEFTRIVSSGYRLVDIDAVNQPGGVFFDVRAVPTNGKAWLARHGMSQAEFSREVKARTSQGYKLVKSDAYASGGGMLHVAIFAKP